MSIELLLVQIAVILILARAMGFLMRLIHQPQVVGEMIAGIMLGPTLLGAFRGGAWMNALFPGSQLPNFGQGALAMLSQIGVMFFMFAVGLELDPKYLRGQGKAALVTGTFGIFVPFVSGALLAAGLVKWFPSVTGSDYKSQLVLMLFMGAAMSITAFPVLARILTERNLQKTRTGVLALTCAAMDDVMGWCILAFVLAVAHMKGLGAGHAGGTGHAAALAAALLTAGLSVAYVAVMVLAVRPVLRTLQERFERKGFLTQNTLAIIFILLLASSLATEKIGIHQIFGAFMLGAVMPKDGRFVRHLTDKIEDFTLLFLLPLFFAFTGLKTHVSFTGEMWLVCGVVILTAVLGKFGGVLIASKWYGMSWRQGSLLGVLMNTRGLMELIILTIGLQIGVLSTQLFSMMVLMALATTFMTTPLMRLLYSPDRQKRELEEAAREEAEKVTGMHVVVPVSLKASAPNLIRLGSMLMGNDTGRVYALHLDRPEDQERRSRSSLAEADAVLHVAQETARQHNVPINAVSFISRNIGRDIADATRRYRASWVVMGWHKPVFLQSILGGTVGQVLKQSPANVAILVDKGLDDVKRILVPYLGIDQDRGALLAAERLGRLPDVKVTILHVVKPGREAGDARLGLQVLVDKELPASGGGRQVRMQVVESNSPIDAVVEESHRHDLMVLGVSEEWNLQASLIGKQESVAQLSQCSLLIVHANPKAPVVVSGQESREAVHA